MKKRFKPIFPASLIIIILIITFFIYRDFLIQDEYNVENNQQTEIKVSEMELEKKYKNLKAHFGEENIQIDYYGDTFNKIRITHLPTGKQQFGNKNITQIENAIIALEKLKAELNE
ncbi:hypothetical protein [Lacinutrix cladophorae]